jgi:hypothetical protein
MKDLFRFVKLASAVVLLSFAPAVLGQNAVTFSGQATAVSGNVAGAPLDLADTGPLPSSGGAQESSLLSESVPGVLTADVLHATTVGQGDRSRSEVSLADFTLTVAGNTITADVLMSQAMAVCTGNGAATSGNSDIVNLAINNMAVGVSGQPNQSVALPGGAEVIINEQQSSPGSMTVNALHVIIPSLAGVPTDLVISSAHADITCQGAAPNCSSSNDFVTGGGWITSTPSNARANFAVAGGIKNGSPWGHLEYIDHGAGKKVKGTAVTYYGIGTTPTSRHIEGTADIDGQPGTYKVDVSDNGDPKGADTFNISLSNGYTAGGPLSGGTIQLHKVCQ